MQHDGHRSEIRKNLRPKMIVRSLQERLDKDSGGELHHVVIELNLKYPGGLPGAREAVRAMIARVLGEAAETALRRNVAGALYPYVFAELTRDQLYAVLREDGEAAKGADEQRAANAPGAEDERTAVSTTSDEPVGPAAARLHLRAIFKVWESTEMRPLTTVSIRTVKADAAQTAYSATGRGIVWAVLDSGIQADHPHFALYENLHVSPPLVHTSFVDGFDPLVDEYGHGTHVAGIIAGAAGEQRHVAALASVGEGGTEAEFHLHDVEGIRGMAPECRLLSLRILKADGAGDVIAAINALEYVLQLNGSGAFPLVHGVNISAGYLPDVNGYATGQTPLCKQVDRVVRSGVSVVVAAGNTGYVVTQTLGANNATAAFEAAQLASINDPGNARLAVTVGSTHREQPHTFGVSYFSSKGPTADGRQKPDLVAPGERIISCAIGAFKRLVAAGTPQGGTDFDYAEDTGTSMAAPHVAGILAAFLSIRREFIGEAEDLRDLLIGSAMDLKRDPRTQGAGLADLMKLVQSV